MPHITDAVPPRHKQSDDITATHPASFSVENFQGVNYSYELVIILTEPDSYFCLEACHY